MPASDPRAVSVELPNLEFAPAASLKLWHEDGNREEVVRARLACRIDTNAAILAFCTASAALVDEIEVDPAVDVPARIAGFVELFRGLTRQVANPDVVGLWGELALIAFSRAPEIVAAAWHADPADVVDFELDGTRLEVKTTRDPARTHWFSRDQLAVSELSDVTLASLVVVPSRSGHTIGGLLERATDRLATTPELADHVVDVATRSIGEALTTSSARFDAKASLRSLRLCSFDQVPTIQVLDDRILEVHWRASLGNAATLTAEVVTNSRFLVALPLPG